MMRARSLLKLGLVLSSLGVLTTSCGSDEATKDGDDGRAGSSSAGQANGGSNAGGRAGGTGLGGAAGQAGGATAGRGPTGPSTLGQACSEGSTTCGDTLECQVWLDIPAGICTTECADDTACRALGPDAACLGGICVEGCSVAALGERCHGREDMVCQAYDSVPGGPCENDDACDIGEFCSAGGTCILPLTACLPSCDSDADCEGGSCDLSLGSCSQEERQGLPVGSKCDPDVPVADDPCEGFCIGAGDGVGFCSGWCRFFGPGCGFEEGDGAAGAACLWPALQSVPVEGEAGFCGQLCDCDDECLHPDLKCVEFTQGGRPTLLYGRRGFCVDPGGEPTITTCDGTSGGAGGAGAGGASSEGEAGSDAGGASGAGTGGAPSEGGAAGAQ